MQRTITVNELQSLLAKKAQITLLDVRRLNDRNQEPPTIPGADWYDPTALEDWSATLNPLQEIVIYCVHGESVSNSVVDALRGKGLNARFIEGGLDAWKSAGGKLES